MRKLFFLLPLAALFIAPLQAFAGNGTTMQVSFIVLDRCTVKEVGTAEPAVNCIEADDFIVEGAQAAAKVPAAAKAPAATPAATSAESKAGAKKDAPADSSEEGWVVFFLT